VDCATVGPATVGPATVGPATVGRGCPVRRPPRGWRRAPPALSNSLSVRSRSVGSLEGGCVGRTRPRTAVLPQVTGSLGFSLGRRCTSGGVRRTTGRRVDSEGESPARGDRLPQETGSWSGSLPALPLACPVETADPVRARKLAYWTGRDEGRRLRPSRRDARAAESGGLENRCGSCPPWVRIPLPPRSNAGNRPGRRRGPAGGAPGRRRVRGGGRRGRGRVVGPAPWPWLDATSGSVRAEGRVGRVLVVRLPFRERLSVSGPLSRGRRVADRSGARHAKFTSRSGVGHVSLTNRSYDSGMIARRRPGRSAVRGLPVRGPSTTAIERR